MPTTRTIVAVQRYRPQVSLSPESLSRVRPLEGPNALPGIQDIPPPAAELGFLGRIYRGPYCRRRIWMLWTSPNSTAVDTK